MMETSIAELKGSILRGVLRDTKEFVRGGIPRVMEELSPEIREATFGQNIFHGMWYPYAAFAALLEAYGKAAGAAGPSTYHQLGMRMADRDFNTLLKAFAMVSGPARLADVPRKVWVQRFRGAGTANSEPGDTSFRFTISGFPDIHPMHCELLTGYGLASGRNKTSAFTNKHDRCVHRGDQHCSWLSRW
jgi:hypothetical protein